VPRALDLYFSALRGELTLRAISPTIAQRSSANGRAFPFAWADFHRFLLGWAELRRQ